MDITTADELLRATEIGRCELVRGKLTPMIPPGYRHGRIIVNLSSPVDNYVRAQGLGEVVAAETGFLLSRDPDTVRAPDIGFLSKARTPGPERGYYPGAPDLAVEVLSPDDRPGYVREKVAEWLEAGTRAVWVVDSRGRTVTVHEHDRDAVVHRDEDTLRGGCILPGFEIPVRDIFA